MNDSKKKDTRELDLDSLELNGFVDTKNIKQAIVKLKEVKVIIDEVLQIKDSSIFPQTLSDIISGYSDKIVSFAKRIEQIENAQPDFVARKKDQLINEIRTFCSESFSLTNNNNSNGKSLLEIYAIAKSFMKLDSAIEKENKKLQLELTDYILEAQKLIAVLKSNKILVEIEDKKNQAETILKELQKKVSEYSVSDYAIVFQDNAKKHKDLANKWLISGIILAVSFIGIILAITLLSFLPTEIIDEETGKLIRYNLTNFFTKIIIIAVVVFLMSFAFKQYNINRHQEVLNTHRQNALNSYQLFIKSIIGDDNSSRNALMIQVAKAIYENSQSTGYLNEKSQNVNSGLIEITKLIGQNSN